MKTILKGKFSKILASIFIGGGVIFSSFCLTSNLVSNSDNFKEACADTTTSFADNANFIDSASSNWTQFSGAVTDDKLFTGEFTLTSVSTTNDASFTVAPFTWVRDNSVAFTFHFGKKDSSLQKIQAYRVDSTGAYSGKSGAYCYTWWADANPSFSDVKASNNAKITVKIQVSYDYVLININNINLSHVMSSSEFHERDSTAAWTYGFRGTQYYAIQTSNIACSVKHSVVAAPTNAVTISSSSGKGSFNRTTIRAYLGDTVSFSKNVITVKQWDTGAARSGNDYTATFTPTQTGYNISGISLTKDTGWSNDRCSGTATLIVTNTATPTALSFSPGSGTATYSTSSQSLSAFSAASCTTGGTFAYTITAGNGSGYFSINSSTRVISIAASTPAGSYSLTLRAKSNASGATKDATYSITINKANSTIPTAPTAKSLTYTGSAQALVNAGTASGGTMNYKLNSGSWGTSVPTATNAGSYTVYYKVVGDANHKDNAGSSVSVTINKASVSITAPTAKSLTYTGSAQALVNAGSGSYVTFYYSLTSVADATSTSIPTKTNAGTYTVYWKATPDGNHSISNTSSGSISVTIAKANPTYTAPVANSLTYNRSAQDLITTGSTSHGTIYYSSNGSSWSTTRPTGTNAGNYTVYWKLTGDSNHKDVASTSIAVTISPKSITPGVTLSDSAFIYTGSSLTPTTVVDDSGYTLTSGTDYDLTYVNSSTSTDDRTSVGTVAVTATLKGNYSGSSTATYVIDGSLLTFIDNYMHMDDEYDRGYCKDSEHHWYSTAKEQLLSLDDNFTNEEYIDAFTSESCYYDAYVRYIAWSHFNGDDNPFSDGRSLSYFINDYYNYPKLIDETASKTPIVLVISAVSLLVPTFCINVYLFKKKKTTKNK